MLINLRNALMAGKRLPYDAEVEYLASTGTQYINTGIKPGPNTRVEAVFAMTTFSANCGLFGARGNATADNNSYNLFIISNNGSRVRWDWSGSRQYQTSEAETSTDATYVLGAAGGDITRNGTTVMSVSASKAAINYPLYVFNFNNVGTPYSTGANARFWSVKIYEGQTLVFDAIPVRKGTVGYLYDRVSGKLFGNAGTGDFVLGPDVVPVEYIESFRGSGGGQYINTGILATTSTKWEIDIAFTTTTTGQLMGSGYAGSQRFNIGIESSAFRGGFGGGWFTISARDTNRHLWRLESLSATQCEASIDGGAAVSYTSTFSPYSGSILLGKRYAAESMTNGARYYANKIWISGDLVQNLLPVRVGTEGAMMDTLTRRIYRNQGTGAFGYGNDLKYPIPA